MGKTLSLDLRERVLAFIVEGHSCHEAARRFRISAASAVRIRQRRRQTGSIAPAKRGRPKGSSRLEVQARHYDAGTGRGAYSGTRYAGRSGRACGVSQDNSGSQARHYDAGTGRGAYSGTRYAGRSGRAVALPQAPSSVTHIKKSLIATERRRKRVRAARYEWRHRAQPRMRLEPHRLVFIPSRQIALQSPAGRGTKRR